VRTQRRPRPPQQQETQRQQPLPADPSPIPPITIANSRRETPNDSHPRSPDFQACGGSPSRRDEDDARLPQFKSAPRENQATVGARIGAPAGSPHGRDRQSERGRSQACSRQRDRSCRFDRRLLRPRRPSARTTGWRKARPSHRRSSSGTCHAPSTASSTPARQLQRRIQQARPLGAWPLFNQPRRAFADRATGGGCGRRAHG